VPVEGAPGVAEKLVGVFTERRSETGLIKLDAGASYVARGKGVYVVTPVQAPSAASGYAHSPRFISGRAKRRRSPRARRSSCCISGCRISPACERRCALPKPRSEETTDSRAYAVRLTGSTSR
jgi:hypothetical protein